MQAVALPALGEAREQPPGHAQGAMGIGAGPGEPLPSPQDPHPPTLGPLPEDAPHLHEHRAHSSPSCLPRRPSSLTAQRSRWAANPCESSAIPTARARVAATIPRPAISSGDDFHPWEDGTIDYGVECSDA
jgi:hypothetical protein